MMPGLVAECVFAPKLAVCPRWCWWDRGRWGISTPQTVWTSLLHCTSIVCDTSCRICRLAAVGEVLYCLSRRNMSSCQREGRGWGERPQLKGC